MAAPLFNVVRQNVLRHTAEHAEHAFDCVVTGCSRDVYQERFDEAHEILRQESKENPMTPEHLWDIATALLCDQHHKSWHIKDSVEKCWRNEFPDLKFSGRRGSSPLSSMSRSTTPQRSDNRVERVVSAPTLPHGLSERDALRDEIVQVSPTPAARHRRRSAPIESSRALQGNASVTVTAGPSSTDPLDHDRAPDHFPSGGRHSDRGRSSTPRPELSMVDEERVHSPDLVDDADQEMVDADREMVPDLLTEQDPPQTTPLGYCKGDGFKRTLSAYISPATTRSRVGELLLKPIGVVVERPRRYIYAIPHINKNHRYVKIGISENPTSRVQTLWNAHKHHHIDCDGIWWFRIALPAAEASRLENLVHTDLAYHRRSLHQTDKKHTEWFEIDMKTAQDTIKLWWKVMEHHNLRPETTLSRQFRTALDVSTFITDPLLACDNQEERLRVHEDHEGRIDWWTKLLLRVSTYVLFFRLFWLCLSIIWLDNTVWIIVLSIQGLFSIVCAIWPKMMP